MRQLFHTLLDPHCRFIRLVLGEYPVNVTLVEEDVSARRHEFLAINPAGILPVLVEEGGFAIPGAQVIAEYLDETAGLEKGLRLLPATAQERVEVRRLINWFNVKFYVEVSEPLLFEKRDKRLRGLGAPDSAVLRACRANLRYHLPYLAHVLHGRDALVGERFTLADFAAAAQLSALDYFGEVPWEEGAVKEWYARLKSRPSFRPLLAERVRGIVPAAHYADLDF